MQLRDKSEATKHAIGEMHMATLWIFPIILWDVNAKLDLSRCTTADRRNDALDIWFQEQFDNDRYAEWK